MCNRLCLGVVLIGASAIICPSLVLAGDYYTSVPALPTVKIGPDANGTNRPEEVFGKEYSHTNWTIAADPRIDNNSDHNASGGLDPLQVVSWDGIPLPPPAPVAFGPNSGSTNGFDYGADTEFEYRTGQVDALANKNDFLFNQVVGNVSTLLFSVSTDLDASSVLPTGPVFAKGHVHWEAPVGPGAGTGIGEGVWAEIEAAPAGPGIIGPGVNHHVVEDLDALEVWGPEPPGHLPGEPDPVEEGYVGAANTADANRFSLDKDSTSGTSVWGWDIATKKTFSYIPHADIVTAVEMLLFEGAEASDDTAALIDVDGTMVYDANSNDVWDTGDELLFTIDPIEMPTDPAGALLPAIDGGEIIHMVNLGGAFGVSYLFHGGHLWNTAFPVAATFGYVAGAGEDVDALESVGTDDGGGNIDTPEPSACLLLLSGVLCYALGRRYRVA